LKPPSFSVQSTSRFASQSSFAATGSVVGNDRRIRRADHPVYDRRRRLAAFQVVAHGRHRHIRYQKFGETPFFGSISTEDGAGASRRPILHSSGHFGDPLSQLFGPSACDKIFAIKNQQQTRFVEMRSRPARRVQSLPRFDMEFFRALSNGLKYRLAQANAARVSDQLSAHLVHDVANADPPFAIGATERSAPSRVSERFRVRPEVCSSTEPNTRAPLTNA
jgi:hypothetical protein